MQAIYGESLFSLGVQELEAVKEDIELYFQKYKFYYAIDAYDLIHFFFPYLGNVQFSKVNVNQLAFEGLAYDTFFSKTGTGDIYIMEEYKEELVKVRNFFFERMNRAYEITRNIDKLSDEIMQLQKDDKELQELAYTNPELCFLFLVFSQRKGKIKEMSFMEFFQKKVYLTSIGTEDEEFNVYANDILLSPERRNFVSIIFDQFQKRQVTTIVEMTEDERERYLFNTFKDIVAVEKVLTLNKMLCSNEKYSKNVFYYLSSTPSKSKIIFELINKTYGNQLPFNSHFRSGKSVHRNIHQVFLFTLLISHYPDSREMPIKLLDLLKSYRLNGLYSGNETAQPADNESLLPVEDNSVVMALDNLISKVSSNIENHVLSALFRNYKSTLDEIASGGKEGVQEFVKTILGIFEQIQLEQSKERKDTQYLQYNVSKHFQASLLKQALTANQDESIMVKIRPGLDVVRLNFHHLPFLIFVYEREAWVKYSSFYEAMNAISEIISESIRHIKPVVSFLKDFFLWWRSSAVKERTQELLMSIYIDLLSIRVIGGSGDQELESNLIAALENRAAVLTSLIDSPYNLTEVDAKKKEENKQLRNELNYVLIWLYRRSNKYDELQRLEREMLADEIEDMRIFHGLGLAYESRFYFLGKKESDKWMLERSMEYLTMAETAYEDFLGKIPARFENIRNLVVKCIIGIGNSNCDTCLRLYDIDPDDELIFEARKILSKIKDHSEILDVNYDLIPIINHTEAELEYYEALLSLKKNDVSIAKMKVNYADRRFKKSVNHPSYMSEESKGIGIKIIELKDIIYSKG